MGDRYEPDKFGVAGFTPMESLCVKPPRLAECSVQMEGMAHEFRSFGKSANANTFEVHIVKLHVDEKLLVGDATRPHIDPSARASSDYELLPVLRTQWRTASFAAGGVEVHEGGESRRRAASDTCVYR